MSRMIFYGKRIVSAGRHGAGEYGFRAGSGILSVCFSGILMLSANSSAFANDKPISFVYSDWCPHICSGKDKKLRAEPGYTIDLISTVFKAAGKDIKFVHAPFSRSLKDVHKGIHDVVVQIKKAPGRDFVWPSLRSGTDQQCFYKRADNKWTYSGVASLKGIRIAGVSGYAYGALTDYLRNDHSSIEFISGRDANGRNLRKVLLGRADTTLENKDIIAYHLERNKLAEKFRIAGCEPKIDLYMAFSPNLTRSRENVRIWEDGLAKLRRSGDLAKILSRYGLKDWDE